MYAPSSDLESSPKTAAESRSYHNRAILSDWRSELPYRIRDAAISSVLLLFFGPLVLLTAGLIKLLSPGPAFIRTQRIGLHGTPFGMYKLRSMTCDAELKLDQLLAERPDLRSEWQVYFKLKRDPRVVPIIGEFIRKSSIDELPQLYNVLRGDMALVGPRPFPTYHLAKFDSDFNARRCSIRPGLTGMWQVEARNCGGLEAQLYWDDQYIGRRSFVMDAWILLKTIPAIIRADNVY